jgi:hypothetical protein
MRPAFCVVRTKRRMGREATMGRFKKRLYYALLMFLMCTAPMTFFSLMWSFDTRARHPPKG